MTAFFFLKPLSVCVPGVVLSGRRSPSNEFPFIAMPLLRCFSSPKTSVTVRLPLPLKFFRSRRKAFDRVFFCNQTKDRCAARFPFQLAPFFFFLKREKGLVLPGEAAQSFARSKEDLFFVGEKGIGSACSLVTFFSHGTNAKAPSLSKLALTRPSCERARYPPLRCRSSPRL